MLSTGTITIEYDGVENYSTATANHIKIIIVNPEGNTIETQVQTITIPASVEDEDYDQMYEYKFKSLAKRLVAQWSQLSGNIYNIQFLGL